MVKGFFLDRIDRKSCRRAVAERIKLAADVPADVAKPCLSIAEAAKPRAEGTENFAVGFGMPPKGLSHGENIPRLMSNSKSLQRLHCGDRVLYSEHEPNCGYQGDAPHRPQSQKCDAIEAILSGRSRYGRRMGA